jgi:hypothetical protein
MVLVESCCLENEDRRRIHRHGAKSGPLHSLSYSRKLLLGLIDLGSIVAHNSFERYVQGSAPPVSSGHYLLGQQNGMRPRHFASLCLIYRNILSV